MDQVLRGLHFAYIYIDDVLIASTSPQEHLGHLRQVFERYQKYNVVINLSKCEFGTTEIDFLGHHVTQNGITPLPEKVKVIHDFPVPVNHKKLREFLGIINFSSWNKSYTTSRHFSVHLA